MQPCSPLAPPAARHKAASCDATPSVPSVLLLPFPLLGASLRAPRCLQRGPAEGALWDGGEACQLRTPVTASASAAAYGGGPCA